MSATVAGIVLTPRAARTLADAEALRQIRNACARWMTGHPHQVTVEQQRAWWASPQRRQSAIWLFDDPDGVPVGFGLLRMRGRWEATLGLLPDWRGQGHGTAIYRHLIARCPGDLYVDVLVGNAASARAAQKAGFVACEYTGVLATLVARRR
jgi:RimJ/RimL family protein N-acetyltransferase